MQRVLPPTLFALLSLCMVMRGWIAPPHVSSTWMTVVGATGLVVGLGLSVIGSRLFARIGTNIRTFDEPGTLVTSGPFRWSRNPMYLGFQVALVGLALVLGSAWALLGPLLFFGACQVHYIPFEEERMQQHFGEDYERYRRQVGRWFGRRKSSPPH